MLVICSLHLLLLMYQLCSILTDASNTVEPKASTNRNSAEESTSIPHSATTLERNTEKSGFTNEEEATSSATYVTENVTKENNVPADGNRGVRLRLKGSALVRIILSFVALALSQ